MDYELIMLDYGSDYEVIMLDYEFIMLLDYELIHADGSICLHGRPGWAYQTFRCPSCPIMSQLN